MASKQLKTGPKAAPGKRPSASSSAAAPSVVKVSTSATASRQTLPKVEPHAPFLLAYNPYRYTVMAGRVVPDLVTVSLTPGVNGMDYRRTPTGDVLEVGPGLTHQREQGLTIIEPTWAPDGVSYLRRYQVETGFFHCLPFVRVFPGMREIEVDEAAYVAWLSDLEARGLIPAPTPLALRRLHEQLVGVLRTAQRQLVRQPSKKAEVDELAKRVAIVAKALDAADDFDASEPDEVDVIDPSIVSDPNTLPVE